MRFSYFKRLLILVAAGFLLAVGNGSAMAGSGKDARKIAKEAGAAIAGAAAAVKKFQNANKAVEGQIAADQAHYAFLAEAHRRSSDTDTAYYHLLAGKKQRDFREKLEAAVEARISYFQDWKTAEDFRKQILAQLPPRADLSAKFKNVGEKVADLRKRRSLNSYITYLGELVTALKEEEKKAAKSETN
jgi:CRISPR/Cas system-associated endonuclease Cas3-HD